MPAETPTEEGRPADSRPCPPSSDPSEASADTPTPSKTSRKTPSKTRSNTPSKKRTVASIVKSSGAKVVPDKVTKSASIVPFRHKWMKKVNSQGVPFGEVGASYDTNADTNEDGTKAPRSGKGKSKTVGFSSSVTVDGTADAATLGDMDAELNADAPQKDVNYCSDGEIMDADGSVEETFMDAHGKLDGDWVPRAMNTMEKARRKLKTEDGVTDPNGRRVGRKLVLWHRPRMMEKLILHLQYECHKAGVTIPWDDVVHRLNPGSSGPSATQMLNKLRDVLITEGHMIPPVLGKSGSAQDPTLRGYIRDMSSEVPTAVKSVRWSDNVNDRKDSLAVPGLIRGSGKYRKVPKSELVPVPKVDLKPGERRNRKPAEVDAWTANMRVERESAKKAQAADRAARRGGSGRGSRSKEVKEESESEADPADLDSDEDYNPSQKKKKRSGRSQKVDWSSSPPYASPTPKSRKRPAREAQSYDVKDSEGTPSSLIVKLRLPSGGLKNLKTGTSGQNAGKSISFAPSKFLFKDDPTKGFMPAEGAEYDEADEIVYLGAELHGSQQLFMKAIQDDTNPRLNGLGFGGDGKKIWNRCNDNPSVMNMLDPEEREALEAFRKGEYHQHTGSSAEDTMEVNDAAQGDEIDQGEYDVDTSDNDEYENGGEYENGEYEDEDEDAPFDVDDQTYGFDNTHGLSSQPQLPPHTFPYQTPQLNGFGSHVTGFDNHHQGEYHHPTDVYDQGNFELQVNSEYQDEQDEQEDDYTPTGARQSHHHHPHTSSPFGHGLPSDGAQFIHSDGVIYEDGQDHDYSNGWDGARSESPAPYTRYITQSYDFEGNNENMNMNMNMGSNMNSTSRDNGFMNMSEYEHDDHEHEPENHLEDGDGDGFLNF